MKNKVLFVALLLTVFVFGALSVNAWKQYNVAEDLKQKGIETQQTLLLRAETKRADAETKEKEQIKAECLEGLAAWNLLSTANQAKTPKPECEISQVE